MVGYERRLSYEPTTGDAIGERNVYNPTIEPTVIYESTDAQTETAHLQDRRIAGQRMMGREAEGLMGDRRAEQRDRKDQYESQRKRRGAHEGG